MNRRGRHVAIRGAVQGVGFRPWVFRLAHELALDGRVWNEPAGVIIEAFGADEALDRFLARLRHEAPPAARIERLDWHAVAPRDDTGFVIAASTAGSERRPSIPPDLATCERCRAEIADPGDRRYRYAFTNCTDCGPRFTLALDVPWDRPATTMAGFAMCPACQREYDDPRDRRFHAQPNACPLCGPRLVLIDGAGQPLPGDALEGAARALVDGAIVAVKGLGGFHLACDAAREDAVLELRARKHRDAKPFALMVPDVACAERLARVDPLARELLSSARRPIVLLPLRPDAALAPSVAPGMNRIGLMLPYTPLHHLLLQAVPRPLVMTSGNLGDSPIVWRDDDALTRLLPIADRLLTHDRPIARPVDDSVVAVIAGGPTPLRRARGMVPESIPVRRRFSAPVLACGAQLQNAFCFGVGGDAWLGPHIGDLDELATYERYATAIDEMSRFLEVRPQVVAHDLHPDLTSSWYARELGRDAVLVAVQHHHAHAVSAMAEHGLEGPALALTWDGTGLGDDGTAWGGELLWVTPERFERLATMRPLRVAGGDEAIRQVWRLAMAALDDAFEGAPPEGALARFYELGGNAKNAQHARHAIEATRRLNRSELALPTHGVGRWFDAFGALGLGRTRAAFEGQVAMAWEAVAQRSALPYPFEIDRHLTPWQVDLRPCVRAATSDLLNGEPPSLVAGAFHATLIAAGHALVRLALRERGRVPLVLSGGCFNNVILAEGLVAQCGGETAVYLHRRVPPGDGGLALGQAVVANAILAGG